MIGDDFDDDDDNSWEHSQFSVVPPIFVGPNRTFLLRDSLDRSHKEHHTMLATDDDDRRQQQDRLVPLVESDLASML
jgi:hypothetical protein